MKKFLKGFVVVMLLFLIVACDKNGVNYVIQTTDMDKTIEVGDSVDYKKYFTIKDDKGNVITITDDMIDASEVDLSKAGTYQIKISYQGKEETIVITVTEKTQIAYQIIVNTEINKTLEQGQTDVDFTKYFTIIASNGNLVAVTNEMLNLSEIDLSKLGEQTLKISYHDLEEEVKLTVVAITYTITVNTAISTQLEVGQEDVDFTKYFIITDSKGNQFNVTSEMLNINEIDLTAPGTQILKIEYLGITNQVTLTIVKPVTYIITVNDQANTEMMQNRPPMDYTTLFIITDSNGKNIEVTEEMIDVSYVDLTQVGIYTVYIIYMGVEQEVQVHVIAEMIYENLSEVIAIIKNIEIDGKGTGTHGELIKVRATVYLDVVSETKLVYLTDGIHMLKLHGDYMHNYTAPGAVYEILGTPNVLLYTPSITVDNPSNEVKKIANATPSTRPEAKEVALVDLVKRQPINEKKHYEDNIKYYKEYLEAGFFTSYLKVTGYLQLDTHNSTTWNYALTTTRYYTKNQTQYIKDALYFKNKINNKRDLAPWEEPWVEYIANITPANEEVFEFTVYGIMYGWENTRKNWMFYVDTDYTNSQL